MNNQGQQQLIDALRNTLTLAEHNPCHASDTTLLSLAKGLNAFLSSELSMDLSRDRAARFLGMSPRSLNRHVQDGTVPPPHHSGHKAISFSALSLANLLRKRKKRITTTGYPSSFASHCAKGISPPSPY